jgi:ribose-phosphate pyrophosphokinase
MSREPALLIGCRAAQHLVAKILQEFAVKDGVSVVEACPIAIRDFPNTEVSVQILQSVRGREVILVQCPCAYEGRTLDTAVREFTLACDALFRASAAHITGILTEFPYQRQERKDRARTPVSAKRVAAEVEKAMGSVGEKRIVSIDLHAPAIQGFFEIPFDALSASTELAPSVAAAGYVTVVSPDVGGAPRAEAFVHLLEDYRDAQRGDPEVHMAVIYKRRKGPERVEVAWVTGAHVLKDRDVVIVDDILGTGGTAREASLKCRELGARRVALAATHAECSEKAWEKLDILDDVFITDSLPLDRLPQPFPAHWHVVPVAPLLAEAITQIVEHGTVSGLEKRRPALVRSGAPAPTISR